MTVQVDTSQVDRGIRQLANGLEKAGPKVGLDQAVRTADRVRRLVPVRSGRLRATVTTVRLPHGAAVTYGGLPYAAYIEKRSHAVDRGTTGAQAEFVDAMTDAAGGLVNRL